MDNKSLFKDIIKLIDSTKDEKKNDHIIMMIESDASGFPVGCQIKSQGQPFTVLGMIDMLKDKLDETRNVVLQRLEQAEMFSKSMGNVPEDYRMKLRELEEKARKAVESNNMELLGQIKAEASAILDELKKLNSDFDKKKDNPGGSSEFNINDFKGGF